MGTATFEAPVAEEMREEVIVEEGCARVMDSKSFVSGPTDLLLLSVAGGEEVTGRRPKRGSSRPGKSETRDWVADPDPSGFEFSDADCLM